MPDEPIDRPVESMTAMAIQAMQTAENGPGTPNEKSAVGKQVFEMIEQNASLSAEQKQEVYRNLAKQVVANACEGLSDPATLLRGTSAGSKFMTSYMETHAANYIAAVEHQAMQAVAAVELPAVGFTNGQGPLQEGQAVEPSPLTPDNLPKAGFKSSPADHISRQDMSAENVAAWDAVYRQASMGVITAMEEQMAVLTPEARAFLAVCADSARQNLQGPLGVNAANSIMANTLALRGALGHLALDGKAIEGDQSRTPEETIRAKVLGQATGVAMSYINALPVNGQLEEVTKPQNKIVNQLRQNEELKQSRQVYNGISHGEVPDTPPDRLAPANAVELVNAAVPGREARFAPPPPAVEAPAVEAPAVEAPAVEAPAVQAPAVEAPAAAPEGAGVAADGEGKKSRLSSVRDALRGAAGRVSSTVGGIVNSAGTALDKKGSEQKLGDLKQTQPDVIAAYKAKQAELATAKNDYLSSVDPTQMDGVKPIANGKAAIAKIESELSAMRKANPGLAQLDRSKVGQVVHSGVRDAAKAIGSRLKN